MGNPKVSGVDSVVLDRGAAIVEFAVLMPLLILLLIGGVETAWLFSQQIDVRHAAREAGRMAATDHGDAFMIAADVCTLMDNSTGATLTLSGATQPVGGDIEATVARPTETLTSLMDWVFPSTMILNETSTFSLEVSPPTWTDSGPISC